ncbi:hypothetical protein AB0I49_00090 [Streptomyces sp. NPDC050617]|uniref:hypothetical protein n=1 Tax=Streptomyces sp. NPDC050617 TaxID=3154628 RepID=UPI0034129368
MATWGLIVESMDGYGQRARWSAGVMGSVEGTREEAMAALETHVRRHLPTQPHNARRTRLFRDGDGLLMVGDTSWRDFYSRFTVAEMIYDSDAPPEPEPETVAAEQEQEPEQEPEQPKRAKRSKRLERSAQSAQSEDQAPDVDRYPDGIPVRPSWLGRDDLP